MLPLPQTIYKSFAIQSVKPLEIKALYRSSSDQSDTRRVTPSLMEPRLERLDRRDVRENVRAAIIGLDKAQPFGFDQPLSS